MRVLLYNLRTHADDGVLGFTTDWINALADRCERIRVVSTDVGAVRVRPNVEVSSVGHERGYGRLRKLVNLYAQTWRILATERIDVCFAHMNYLFPLFAWPLLRMRRVPVVLWYAHGAVPFLLRPAAWVAARIVTSSESGFRLRNHKLRIVGQGIDTRRFAPCGVERRSGPFRLLTLGRISRIKRLEVVIDAMARIRVEFPALDVECDLVGDPPDDDGRRYREELEMRIAALGLQDRVRLLPGVPFPVAHEVIATADLFVNSADTDSVDKTVLEAMSCGVPVVTSNAAFKDVLPHDLQPLLLISKNDVPALVRAVCAIEGLDADRRRELSNACRAVVLAGHSLDALADRIIEQLQEVRP